MLVGFCGVEGDARLPAGFDSWSFGDPPWFVSSRVISDEQLLRRVWREQSRVGTGKDLFAAAVQITRTT